MTHYKALKIKGPIERQEEAELFLQDAGIDAYEVVSADAIDAIYDSAFVWDAIDEDVLSVPSDVFELRAYFDGEREGDLRDLYGRVRTLGFEAVVEDIADADWANDWKKYFHPIAIDEHLSIVPSWEEYEPDEGESVIVLDPGMAFGSGNHATSYLCSRYLREYVRESDTVIDIGCGSGILSLVAAASGAGEVVAVDMDPQCILATRENAQKNDLVDRIDVREGDLFSAVSESGEVVVSNIFAEVIIDMLPDVADHVKPGGIYIASGILKEKLTDVEEALKGAGFELLDSRTDGDWSALAARRVS
ncbi:MAG: 50S ribosomal protein L11 methyltransferase [Firmicutes bacterium]|nr:50S ribosomal protein L11 methyltransferase [Bacillota bacterium]